MGGTRVIDFACDVKGLNVRLGTVSTNAHSIEIELRELLSMVSGSPSVARVI